MAGLWSVYAVVSLLVKYTAWMSVIVHAFQKGRSLALAIVLCGPAAGSALAPPLAQILIDGYGWRTAYVALGIGWMVPTWFLALLSIRDVRLVERNCRVVNNGRRLTAGRA